ncbi:complement receptor type 2-like isoform X2 [Ambystoma mexicanum]|uniref:complement receptor type 2-like isoform X2 n=1 Tax=Ambystoma mexicanum TaxID=8296 RepID=UPI0037E86B85
MVVAAQRWSRGVALCWVWLGALVGRVHGSCAPPPAWSYAVPEEVPVGDSYAVGDILTYVCDAKKGFLNAADEVGTIECLEDSSWSEFKLICDAGCGEPPNFQYGELMEKFLLVKAFAVGSSVTYKCRPGFVLKPRTPRPIIKCLAPQKWSERAEFCQRRDCGNPGEPQNGRVHLKDGEDDIPDTYFGSAATFSCLTGFTLVGRKTRICEATGWSNAVPICEPVTCDEPPDTPNGRHSGYGQEDFYYLSAVTYSCTADYFELLGNRLIHCTEKGTWSGPAPTCKDRRCPRPAVENGRQISGFKVLYLLSDKVEFSCNEGFITKNARHVQCGEENEWVPKLPICQPIVCGPPPRIENGTHDGLDREEFEYRKVVRYRCAKEELSMIGADTIQCVGEDQWSGPAPRCKDVHCESPVFANGTMKSYFREPFRYDNKITFECNAYFKLKGPSLVRCDENSKWEPDVPTCIDRRCPRPAVENGRQISGFKVLYLLSDKVEFSCNEGFITKNARHVQCGEENEWVPKLPICQPIVCGPPPRIENGTHDGLDREEFEYRKVVRYRCAKEELSMIGADTIQCVGEDQWSGPAPRCKDVHCESPVFANGTMKSYFREPFRYDNKITFECNAYFKLKGPSLVRCDENSKWEPDVPTCIDQRCLLPEVKNVKRIIPWKPVFVQSDLIRVECDLGFVLVGKAVIRCTQNNRWVPPFPACRPVTCRQPPEIVDGIHSGTSQETFGYQETVVYQCNSDDLSLIGTKTITCQRDETWSDAAPTCQDVRCVTPHEPNGNVTSNSKPPYKYGSSVTFECNTSFKLKGARTVHCQADSTWKPPLPTCERTTCPDPAVANGRATTRKGNIPDEGYKAKTQYQVVCDVGYTLSGAQKIECGSNLEWPWNRGTSNKPNCLPMLCQEPSIENGSVLPITGRRGKLPGEVLYDASSLAEVRCNSGYTLNGSERIQCQATSAWSPLPTCHPVRCNEPTVENGQIVCRQMKTPGLDSGFRLHDNITFHCDAGFTMRGAKMVQCIADSTWSALPTCEADELTVEPTQCPSRLLPLGQRNLTEAELSNLHEEMVFPASSEDICKSVMKGLKEDWEKMNVEDKWTYLQMKKLCMEIGNSELQSSENHAQGVRIPTTGSSASSLPHPTTPTAKED